MLPEELVHDALRRRRIFRDRYEWCFSEDERRLINPFRSPRYLIVVRRMRISCAMRAPSDLRVTAIYQHTRANMKKITVYETVVNPA